MFQCDLLNYKASRRKIFFISLIGKFFLNNVLLFIVYQASELLRAVFTFWIPLVQLCFTVSQALRSARGAPSHSPPPLRPYSMCPPPPLREISGAGYRDYSPEPPPNSSLPPSHCSCYGPPQVSLLLDNGPSVARWDSDTSFFIRRQAYSSSEVTPPLTP